MNAQSVLEQARQFLHHNARLLDRMRFAYHFEGGSKEAVIEALRAYQNPDGGFGNALEPDIRCPHSQPVPTEMALMIMDEVDGFDARIVEGIGSYLQGVSLPEGGIPFTLPSVNEYPHAPWWTSDGTLRPSMNPTGRIAGLLFKQNAVPGITGEEWFARNVRYIWSCVENEKPSGYHDGGQWLSFLQHAPECERAAEWLAGFDAWLVTPGIMERDPHAEGYVHKVLDWAPASDSHVVGLIPEDELHVHLRAMVGQQQEDGGWPISWPAVSPCGELEWRGVITVERLKTLRSFGYI